MSFEVVKITDFVETLIFALRATLKKGLEESASHHVIFFCAAALGRASICNSIRTAHWGSPLYGEPLKRKVNKKISDQGKRLETQTTGAIQDRQNPYSKSCLGK